MLVGANQLSNSEAAFPISVKMKRKDNQTNPLFVRVPDASLTCQSGVSLRTNMQLVDILNYEGFDRRSRSAGQQQVLPAFHRSKLHLSRRWMWLALVWSAGDGINHRHKNTRWSPLFSSRAMYRNYYLVETTPTTSRFSAQRKESNL